jgi:hypothetical protein
MVQMLQQLLTQLTTNSSGSDGGNTNSSGAGSSSSSGAGNSSGGVGSSGTANSGGAGNSSDAGSSTGGAGSNSGIILNNVTDSTVTNSTTNNITINNYGSENIDHILQDHEFMTRCVKTMLSEGIPELLRKIHFDDEHPENQNVRLRSLKRDLMEIFADRWKVVPGTKTTEKLIHKGLRLLGEFYDTTMRENPHDETDQRYQKIMMIVVGRSGNEYFAVRRHTKAMIQDETERRRA